MSEYKIHMIMILLLMVAVMTLDLLYWQSALVQALLFLNLVVFYLLDKKEAQNNDIVPEVKDE